MSIGKLLKSIVLFVLFLVIGLMIVLTVLSQRDRANGYAVDLDNITIPKYTQQVIEFVPTYDATKTLPFTAGAIVDIDGDGVEEVFIGGGIDQQDAFYRYVDGSFKDITTETAWIKETPDKTFSAISLDFDVDGDNDLIITRQSGVFLYTNASGAFTAKKLDLDLDQKSVPLSVAVADINRDGLYDMYVSGYIARKHVEGETIFNQVYGGISALYVNTGDDTFDNITEQAGMLYQHNTFQAVFIDVDGDRLEDIVVAHDTGTVRTWKNNGDLTFNNMPNPSSDYFSYPMGIAVTDLKNDGFPDFFFSNVGSTVPSSLVRGDLREDQILHQDWLLFENQGDFSFVDSASEKRIAAYEFSWGAVFEDFNLDGRDDLAVSENYAGWPLHNVPFWRLNGRFLLQNEQGVFAEAGDLAGVQNREYGISPLVADFNQDGYPDLVHINILGPQNVFLSEGGDQGYLKVRLPNSIGSVGAVVAVKLADGSTINQTFVVGEGLLSDQSHMLTFGLGDQEAISVSATALNGTISIAEGSYRNETIQLMQNQ